MQLNLKELLYVVYSAAWSLGMSDRDTVLNICANILQEKHGVSEEDLKKEFEELGVPRWEKQEDEDEDEDEDQGEDEEESDRESMYGECGFRCDGHCQTCDPGYMDRMRYGTYDGADEV